MNKPVNTKSIKAPKNGGPGGWRKYSFYFDTAAECNLMAMPIACFLRTKCSHLYYARYTGALESRLDIYFLSPVRVPINKEALQSKRGEYRWIKVVGPEIVDGSFGHAAGFECVVRCAAAFKELTVDQQRFQFLDVIHWMQNMMGYDYVDEARNNLQGVAMVLGVFENSIRLGNRLSKSQRKAPRGSSN